METRGAQNNDGNSRPNKPGSNALLGLNLPQKSIMGVILVVALLAFELFNFDTTRYAPGQFARRCALCWCGLGHNFGDCLLCHRFCWSGPTIYT